MTDLRIPDAVRAVFARLEQQPGLAEAGTSPSDWEEFDGYVREIAKPIVAAELCRLADLMEGYGHLSAKAEVHQTHLLDARALRSRADELGPPR